MENPIAKENYGEIRARVKAFYKSIGRIWCPALHDFVYFHSAGFFHLIKKGRTPRVRSEQKRRFDLLHYAISILNTQPFSSTEERMVGAIRVQYWKFIENHDGIAVKIIVRQIGDKRKHFLSIYGKRQKSAPEGADS